MPRPAATRFVGPLSFAALSRHPVETDVLGSCPTAGSATSSSRIRPMRSVAPARRTGSARWPTGSRVTSSPPGCLAACAPVVVAPAMDGDMWTHPATVANVAGCARLRLRDRPPEAGPLASGQSGRATGRPGTIVDAVVAAVGGRSPVASRCGGATASRPAAARGGPDRAPRRRDRRRHARVDRSRPLHRQPLDREDGPSPSRRRRSTRGAGDAHRRQGRGAARPGRRSSGSSRPRSSRRARAAIPPTDGTPVSMPSLWPASPTSGPSTPPTRKIRGDGLTLEPSRRRTSSPDAQTVPDRQTAARASPPRPVLVGFAAETGSLDRAADKLRPRASTSSSPTT